MSGTVRPPILLPEHAAFVQGSVSIVAASCDAQRVPSIGRVAGCAVAADRCTVSVFVAARQAPALLADIRACGRIAVVFSRPSNNRSLQLKGDDATVRPATERELAIVARYVEAFGEEITPLGYGPEQARTLFACVDGDRVAIDFTPSAAFEQTPGPNAGTAIALPR
ncbi:MAG: pyridoxamine 5'-phosphate oxidase family protein [Burkholderiales bacterium]